MDMIFFYTCSLEITWGLQQYDSELKGIFFKKNPCYLPTPQLTLGHSQGGSLTNPMLINRLNYFDPNATGILLAKLGPYAQPST